MSQIQTIEKKHNYFYRITNQINWKYYFGIHSTDKDPEKDGYFGGGLKLIAAIKKHGKENFVLTIIQDYATRKEASDHERLVVDFEMINNPMCYNARTGGDNEYVYICSEETREKLRLIGKKRKWTDEQKQKASESRKALLLERPDLVNFLGDLARGGNLITDVTRSKMRKNRANQVITPESRIQAVETRRNNGQPWHTDEQRQKLSEGNWLRKLKEEAGPDGIIDYKPWNAMECIIEGVHFKSIADAQRVFKNTAVLYRIHSKSDKWKEWKLVVSTENEEV